MKNIVITTALIAVFICGAKAQIAYQFNKTTDKQSTLNLAAVAASPDYSSKTIQLGFNFPFDGSQISEVQLEQDGIRFSYGNKIANLTSHVFDSDIYRLVNLTYYFEPGAKGIFEFIGTAGTEQIKVQIVLERSGVIKYIYGPTPASLATAIKTEIAAGIEVFEIIDFETYVTENIIYVMTLAGNPNSPNAITSETDEALEDFPGNEVCYKFTPGSGSLAKNNALETNYSVSNNLDGDIKVIGSKKSFGQINYVLRDHQGNILSKGTKKESEFVITKPSNSSLFYILELESGGVRKVMKINTNEL